MAGKKPKAQRRQAEVSGDIPSSSKAQRKIRTLRKRDRPWITKWRSMCDSVRPRGSGEYHALEPSSETWPPTLDNRLTGSALRRRREAQQI